MVSSRHPPRILQLPDELIEAIVIHLSPTATVAFGNTCKRCHKIADSPQIWRQHCQSTWRYWSPRHGWPERHQLPSAQAKWRQLYSVRHTTDRETLHLFDQMLQIQQFRHQHMEEISDQGYDVKDLLLSLRDNTPAEDDDYLARTYHANAILGQIHRAAALEQWMRLQQRRMVSLERVLGAFDMFVLSCDFGDLDDLDQELGRIAEAVRTRDPEFDEKSTRYKAVQIAQYLRSEKLVGNPQKADFHALRNNFITMALFDTTHSSLPLQSVAIYCAIARRLGVSAKPSNYPHHVHAVIEAPSGKTLDGAPFPADSNADSPRVMYLDPWRSSDEVLPAQLHLRLSQMGAPPEQHSHYLGPSSNLDVAIRTSRNIMHSVQEARDRQRGMTRGAVYYPDIEAAWYSMLWSMLVLGDNTPVLTLHRRRQCLPYLVEQYQTHFPEDTGLIERHIAAMFQGEREHEILSKLVEAKRAADTAPILPCPRDGDTDSSVRFRIGTYFQHKRYGYFGVVIGWDARCAADDRWIAQMGVDTLVRGRHQPFYNVIVDDKTVRYVAEENVQSSSDSRPPKSVMRTAGRWFKRWDDAACVFVSNIRDEYPED